MAALDDLVSIEQVNAYVEPQDPTGRAALLGDFITRASRLTRSFTRRRFTKPPFVGERRFYLQQSRYVHTEDPLSAIAYVRGEGSSSATVEGESAGLLAGFTTVDLAYRAVDPEDPQQRLDPRVILEEPYTGPVVISASFGWSEIPPDVVQAVLVAVGIWFDRDVANTSTTFSLEERRTQTPEALPAQSQAILAPYQRQGAGIG